MLINFIYIYLNYINKLRTKFKLPVQCPSCESQLKVAQLACENCDTTVSGLFALPTLLQLPPDEQDFIMQFFLTSGSLKQMAQQMNISYPTVRNKLDDIIEHIKVLQTNDTTKN